jgi:threonine dehydrogenase-like Zn-dependent dehydrogenase
VNTDLKKSVLIVGGGPSGLFAAERLSAAGVAVTIVDRMPSVARKLLMAGRGGLNLTHSEGLKEFLTRYGTAAAPIVGAIHGFRPLEMIAWVEGWKHRASPSSPANAGSAGTTRAPHASSMKRPAPSQRAQPMPRCSPSVAPAGRAWVPTVPGPPCWLIPAST